MAVEDIPDGWRIRILDDLAVSRRQADAEALGEVLWPADAKSPRNPLEERTHEDQTGYIKLGNTMPTKFDPDLFQTLAKQTVVDNFNQHRNQERSPELSLDGVYIVWFVKVLGNWKAIVASPLARGLLWEVSYNGDKNEIYLDIYSKLNNTKISLGKPEPRHKIIACSPNINVTPASEGEAHS